MTAPSRRPPQVIYMARNPKDLVVSYYQFHRSLRTMSYRGTFQEFCRRFMNDKRKCAGHTGVPRAAPGRSPRPRDRRARRPAPAHGERLGLRSHGTLVRGGVGVLLCSLDPWGVLRSSPAKSTPFFPGCRALKWGAQRALSGDGGHCGVASCGSPVGR